MVSGERFRSHADVESLDLITDRLQSLIRVWATSDSETEEEGRKVAEDDGFWTLTEIETWQTICARCQSGAVHKTRTVATPE